MQSIEWLRTRSKTRCGAALAAVVGAGIAIGAVPADAQMLVNRDEAARSVTVILKSEHRQETLDAGAALENFCPDGCVIRIDKDETRDFIVEGDERLSIDAGLVYFDGLLRPEPEGAAAGARDGASGGATRTE